MIKHRNRNRYLFGSRLSKALSIGLVVIAVLVGSVGASDQLSRKPFQPPVAGDPGYDTWYMSQPYGNTTFAHHARIGLYPEGQGIHFGVDFMLTCGTPILSIGDGTVYSIDGPYGSWPHNIVIRHDNGYYSLYGHLRTRPVHLVIGQQVKTGDVIGESGDSLDVVNCNLEPHLHLEIRTDNMRMAVNPIPLIDASWWNDASLGIASDAATFQVDLEAPRRWQSLYDQPDVRFGGPRLNDYTDTWPR